MSPRVFRVVALPAPSDREKSQMYMQRYVPHLPAAGEIVIFDRSWYNRGRVEYVMGFCTKEQHRRFLELCPAFEGYLVSSGIMLLKFWLEVSNEEQERCFEARITDPLRQWKLSPMDLPSALAGMTTRERATLCWRQPTARRRLGTSCDLTTKSGHGLTASPIC